MRRVVAICLSLVMVLTACAPSQTETSSSEVSSSEVVSSSINEPVVMELVEFEPEYESLNDSELLTYVEDAVYREAIDSLDSDEYIVEDVEAVYISKEYLEELAYNSKSNIFFGYTIAELDEVFEGKKYVFTLGEDGTTVVQEQEELEEFDVGKMLTDLAVGTGIVLVCVTVTTAASAVGAPAAITTFFAGSAKVAKILASESPKIVRALISAVVLGVGSGDVNKGVESGVKSLASEYKWTAFAGKILDESSSLINFQDDKKSDISMSDASRIQVDSKWPLDVISEMENYSEYEIYKNAGLKTKIVNGKTALIQDIDIAYLSVLSDGTEISNLERMKDGLPPIDPETNKPYQLHHIGEEADSTLVILKENQEFGNISTERTEGIEDGIEKEFWQNFANMFIESAGL